MNANLVGASHGAATISRGVRLQRGLIFQAGLVLLMMAMVLAGFFYTNAQQQALIDLREGGRQMRIALGALMEADAFVLNRVVLDRVGDSGAFARAIDALDSRRESQIAQLTPFLRADPKRETESGKILFSLKEVWTQAIALAHDGKRADALALLGERDTGPMVERLRQAIDSYLEDWNDQFPAHEQRVEVGKVLMPLLVVLFGGVMLFAFWSAAADAKGRAAAMAEATASRRQVTRLFEMTDMLQSAADILDANAVLKATADELIADFGGALYVFNNSRDRLTLSTSWEIPEGRELPTVIAPNQCWALKRGKPHINRADPRGLCCEHHVAGSAALEIPMIARGEILGLLQIFSTGSSAEARLDGILPLGSALADGMSLALANIALREKLRSQALRDPLTGLYNRRYMEDSLERFVRLAERENRKFSVIMIDLDHFKRLNDEHGHATGDAVLREAAAAVVGALRETDVACRYGGEEMIVLLPDCDLDKGAEKAETIRQRIEALSGQHGAAVSASFGVSCIPSTSNGSVDLVRAADAALYKAKQAGRNCVATAPQRSGHKANKGPDAVDPAPLLQAAE